MSESIGKAYKPWLMVSLAVLLASLGVLCVTGTVAFVKFSGEPTPLWLVVIGGAAAVGLATGFGGFLLIMLVAGWSSFREGRRVQVLPPE